MPPNTVLWKSDMATCRFVIQSRNACGTSFPFITRLLDCSNFPLNNSAPSIGRNPVKGDGDWRGSTIFFKFRRTCNLQGAATRFTNCHRMIGQIFVCLQSMYLFVSISLIFFLGIMTKLWKKIWTEQNSKLNERTLELQITDWMTKYVNFKSQVS